MKKTFICHNCERSVKLGLFARLEWNGKCMGCDDYMIELGKNDVCTYPDDTNGNLTSNKLYFDYGCEQEIIKEKQLKKRNIILEDEEDLPKLDKHKFD